MSKATEPVILTQAQIQAIGALLKNTDELQTLRAVRFRRDSLVVVNGHLLLRLPLEPADRDFAVDGVLLAKWTGGFPPTTRMQIESDGATVTVKALGEDAKSKPRGYVVLPAWTYPTTTDATIENLFAQFKPDAPLARFGVSHRYLDMAREFVDVFGIERAGTAMELLNADEPTAPIRFRFLSVLGAADMIVMPMRL
jgi:hypothetical protein